MYFISVQSTYKSIPPLLCDVSRCPATTDHRPVIEEPLPFLLSDRWEQLPSQDLDAANFRDLQLKLYYASLKLHFLFFLSVFFICDIQEELR